MRWITSDTEFLLAEGENGEARKTYTLPTFSGFSSNKTPPTFLVSNVATENWGWPRAIYQKQVFFVNHTPATPIIETPSNVGETALTQQSFQQSGAANGVFDIMRAFTQAGTTLLYQKHEGSAGCNGLRTE